ncbi:unnamed protein product [Paramecium pentaurelia]|uniref:Uncharacterized protein n=1 Tax=Paramecium pentaurelia TaxID=43138 RepID=A0A8S1WJJ3_9CILI|nr:unnamed protein product [Paramecium pentaurelia]
MSEPSIQQFGKLNIVIQQQLKPVYVSKEERKKSSYQQQHQRKKSFNEVKKVEIPVFMGLNQQTHWMDLWDQFKKETSIDEQNSILEKILKLKT